MMIILAAGLAHAADMTPQSASVVLADGVDGVPWAELEGNDYRAPRRGSQNSARLYKGAFSEIEVSRAVGDAGPSHVIFWPVVGKADPARWGIGEAIAGGYHPESSPWWGKQGVWYTTRHEDVYLKLAGGKAWDRGRRSSAREQGGVFLLRVLDGRELVEVFPALVPIRTTERLMQAALSEGLIWQAMLILEAGGLGAEGELHGELSSQIYEAALPIYGQVLVDGLATTDPVERQALAHRVLEADQSVEGWNGGNRADFAVALRADADVLDAQGRTATAWGSRVLANTLVMNWDRPPYQEFKDRFRLVPERLATSRDPASGDLEIEIRSTRDRLVEDVQQQGEGRTITCYGTHTVSQQDAVNDWKLATRQAESDYWQAVVQDCPGGRQQVTAGHYDPGGWDPVATRTRTEQRLDCPPGQGCRRVVEEITTTTWEATPAAETPPQITYCSDRQREADERRRALRFSNPEATRSVMTTREVFVADQLQIWSGTYERVVALVSPEGEELVTQRAAPDPTPRLRRMAEGMAGEDRVNEWRSREEMGRVLSFQLDQALRERVEELAILRIERHVAGLEGAEVEAAWLRHIALLHPPPARYRWNIYDG